MVTVSQLFEEMLPKFVSFFREHFHDIFFPFERLRIVHLHADFKVDKPSCQELLLKPSPVRASLVKVFSEGGNVQVHVSHRKVGLGRGIVEDSELKEFIVFNISHVHRLVTPVRFVGGLLFLYKRNSQ